MTGLKSDLRVEMVGDEILITLPQSHYAVTYYKPKNSPQLLAKRISDKDDPRLPMTGAQFLVKA
jgi:hypothetical protein